MCWDGLLAFTYRPGHLFNPIDDAWRQCDFGNLPVPTLGSRVIDPVVYSCPLTKRCAPTALYSTVASSVPPRVPSWTPNLGFRWGFITSVTLQRVGNFGVRLLLSQRAEQVIRPPLLSALLSQQSDRNSKGKQAVLFGGLSFWPAGISSVMSGVFGCRS
jgi:hypothetical protein